MVFELPQVAHYSGGEYFKAHEDAFPMAIAAEKGYQRRATVLVYLNDVEKARLRFNTGHRRATKKGKALVFFPSAAACMPDARTLHTATEAESGHEKWVSQLWITSSTPPGADTGGAQEENKKKAPPPSTPSCRESNVAPWRKSRQGGEEGG